MASSFILFEPMALSLTSMCSGITEQEVNDQTPLLIKRAAGLFAVKLIAPYSFTVCVCVYVCVLGISKSDLMQIWWVPVHEIRQIPALSITTVLRIKRTLFILLPATLFKVINLNLPKRQKSLLDRCHITRPRAHRSPSPSAPNGVCI